MKPACVLRHGMIALATLLFSAGVVGCVEAAEVPPQTSVALSPQELEATAASTRTATFEATLPTPYPTPPGTPSPTPLPIPPRPTAAAGGPPLYTPEPTPSQPLPDRVMPSAEAVRILPAVLGRWEPAVHGAVTGMEFVEVEGAPYVIVAAGQAFHLFEVTPSGDLVYVRALHEVFAHWIQDFKVSGNLLAAVVRAGSNPGLALFDIQRSSERSLIELKSRSWFKGDFTSVQIEGDRAYLIAGETADDQGVVIVDISDPGNPVRLGKIEPWFDGPAPRGEKPSIPDVRVRGNLVYAAMLEPGMVIFDVSDPASPREVGRFKTTGWADAVAIEGDIAYVANNASVPFAVWTVDITDPANPAFVSRYDGSTVSGGITQLRVHDRLPYYLTYNTGWIGVAWRLGAIEADGQEQNSDRWGAEQIGAFPFDLEFTATHAYVTDSLGVVAVPLAGGPDQPTLDRTVKSGVRSGRIHVFQQHVFLFTLAGLRVIDVRDLTSPTEVAMFPIGDRMPALVEGDRAYFYLDRETDRVLDLSEPSHPRWLEDEVGSSHRGAPCTGSNEVEVGDLCYRRSQISGQMWGIEIARKEGRDRRVVASIALGEDKQGGIYDVDHPIAVAGPFVYVIGNEGLFVLDARDPERPNVASHLPISGGVCRVGTSFDLSHRGAILVEACHYERLSVHIEGDRLYVQKGGVHVIDISEPAAPREIGVVSVYGTSMTVENGTLYVVDLDGGLAVSRAQ